MTNLPETEIPKIEPFETGKFQAMMLVSLPTEVIPRLMEAVNNSTWATDLGISIRLYDDLPPVEQDAWRRLALGGIFGDEQE